MPPPTHTPLEGANHSASLDTWDQEWVGAHHFTPITLNRVALWLLIFSIQFP